MVWPTLGSRMAEEQNTTEVGTLIHLDSETSSKVIDQSSRCEEENATTVTVATARIATERGSFSRIRQVAYIRTILYTYFLLARVSALSRF